MNHHEVQITKPDESSKYAWKDQLSHGEPNVIIPGPNDAQASGFLRGKAAAPDRGRRTAMSLAWRGVRILASAFFIAAAWFVVAWVHHRQMPLAQPDVVFSIGSPPERILPPAWLVAVLGMLSFVSLALMLIGTQRPPANRR